MTQDKAIELFDRMYSARTLRDTLSYALSLHESGKTVLDANALRAFRRMEREYNAQSTEAALQMRDGWIAYRDESLDYVPVLKHMGRNVAMWHGFGAVEIVA